VESDPPSWGLNPLGEKKNCILVVRKKECEKKKEKIPFLKGPGLNSLQPQKMTSPIKRRRRPSTWGRAW
jgi:hypothetical protein